MSISFSDTTNKDGLIQNIEDECGFNDGDISGSTTKLKKFTSDINNALDEIFALIFKTGGTWQFDDVNHVDYPIITTNLNSGQRDYAFSTDEQGNIVLDIYKVMIKNPSGVYVEIYPVDQQSANNTNYNVDSIVDGQGKTGTPIRYDKTANGIFLDPIPSYTSESGLKLFINREASRFTTSDTTKKAGFSGLFHYLLVLIPSYKYARIHLPPADRDRLKIDIGEMKGELIKHYGKRERDIKRSFRPSVESNK